LALRNRPAWTSPQVTTPPGVSCIQLQMEPSSANDPKPTLFVVDDEPVIVQTLVAILTHAGFAVSGFTSPVDALRAAETNCPDFLLSDVIMPTLNGIDLATQFKVMYPRCKILLFSGQAMASDLLENAHEGGHRFEVLAKPTHPDQLLAAIKALSNRSPKTAPEKPHDAGSQP